MTLPAGVTSSVNPTYFKGLVPFESGFKAVPIDSPWAAPDSQTCGTCGVSKGSPYMWPAAVTADISLYDAPKNWDAIVADVGKIHQWAEQHGITHGIDFVSGDYKIDWTMTDSSQFRLQQSILRYFSLSRVEALCLRTLLLKLRTKYSGSKVNYPGNPAVLNAFVSEVGLTASEAALLAEAKAFSV